MDWTANSAVSLLMPILTYFPTVTWPIQIPWDFSAEGGIFGYTGTAGLPFDTQTGQFLCIEIKHTPEKGLFIAVLYSSDSDMQNNGGDFKVNQNRADIHNGGNQRGSHQRRVQMDMFCNQRQAAADKF